MKNVNFFRSSFFVEHLLTAGSAFFQAGLLVLSSDALEQIVLDKKIFYASFHVMKVTIGNSL